MPMIRDRSKTNAKARVVGATQPVSKHWNRVHQTARTPTH